VIAAGPVTIDVGPDQIRFYVADVAEIHKRTDRGQVWKGDWDRKVHDIQHLDIYLALREHVCEGTPWAETGFYRRVAQELESGRVKWNCRTLGEFDDRCEKIDRLYVKIRDDGYRRQSELPECRNTPKEYYDEIGICIGRDGDLLFHDGRHRLSIAMLLGLKSVPVQVTIRHAGWEDLRKRIMACANKMGGKTYAPLLHPDLAHIPSQHDHKRWELIRNNLPLDAGSVLDIGAHWGYFSHMFEAAGFDCHAVEKNDDCMYFLGKLRRAQNRKFRIIKQSVLDDMDKYDFDVVLAINIFHHFIKTEELHEKLVGLLSRLDMKFMYFGAHLPTEGQMRGSFRNYQPDEFVRFILSESCLTSSRLLGESRDGRRLYMLWK
jgi:hypothetical protein